MKGSWYTVKATDNDQNTVEFDFFGDPNSPASLDLAREIAKNKLHTTESVLLNFKMM